MKPESIAERINLIIQEKKKAPKLRISIAAFRKWVLEVIVAICLVLILNRLTNMFSEGSFLHSVFWIGTFVASLYFIFLMAGPMLMPLNALVFDPLRKLIKHR